MCIYIYIYNLPHAARPQMASGTPIIWAKRRRNWGARDARTNSIHLLPGANLLRTFFMGHEFTPPSAE